MHCFHILKVSKYYEIIESKSLNLNGSCILLLSFPGCEPDASLRCRIWIVWVHTATISLDTVTLNNISGFLCYRSSELGIVGCTYSLPILIFINYYILRWKSADSPTYGFGKVAQSIQPWGRNYWKKWNFACTSYSKKYQK